MKGHTFAGDKDTICIAKGYLKQQDQQFFYNGIRALETCWAKCISDAGDYVKRDKMWWPYLVINCVTLRTFWTTLVHVTIYVTNTRDTNQGNDFQIFLVCSFCIHQLPYNIICCIHCKLLLHTNTHVTENIFLYTDHFLLAIPSAHVATLHCFQRHYHLHHITSCYTEQSFK